MTDVTAGVRMGPELRGYVIGTVQRENVEVMSGVE